MIRTVAEVSEPSSVERLTRKSTRTWSPSRSTVVTLPTFTPAMRTSSPDLRPPASDSAAACDRPASSGMLSMLKASSSIATMTPIPIAPITTGFFSRNGVPPPPIRRFFAITGTSPPRSGSSACT